MLECANQHRMNNCNSIATSIPYMKAICSEWEACMQSDPRKVQKLGILGEVFATLINSLINPLTWKALVY